MQLWLFLVYFLFPIPLLSILLLSLPFPAKVRIFIMGILDHIIFLRINSFITLYHFATGLSIFLFFKLLSDTTKYHSHVGVIGTVTGLSESKCLRWRAERNFWISAFSMTLWLILYKFRSLVKQIKQD